MVTAVNNTSAVSTASRAGGSVSAQEQTDRFMKLLVAQLNNQDPMNPLDNAQMTSQIAQINTVSGIQELNSTMQSMAAQFNSMQMLQGAGMVGRGVLLQSNTLSVEGDTAKGAVQLAGKADKVTLDIKTPGGQLLDTINLGPLPAGQSRFQWDASKYPGVTSVNVSVSASLGGQSVGNTTLAQETVTGVGNDNGSMAILLKGRSPIAYSDVQSIV